MSHHFLLMKGRPSKKKLIKIIAVFGGKEYTFDTSSKTKFCESIQKYKENEGVTKGKKNENKNSKRINSFLESDIELKQTERKILNTFYEDKSNLTQKIYNDDKIDPSSSSILNNEFEDIDYFFFESFNNKLEQGYLTNDLENIDDIMIDSNDFPIYYS